MAKVIKGSLVLRKGSNWWYGRYKAGKKEHVTNLQVEVKGNRPATLKEDGSKLFEKSRTEAEAALRILIEKINEPRAKEEVAQAVHRARYGQTVAIHSIEDLPKLWEGISRKRKPSEAYKKQCLAWLNDFLAYSKEHHPDMIDVDYFQPDQAKAYMDWQEGRGISPKTWNDILVVLKTAFKEAGATAFDKIIAKDIETISRKPYSADELHAILEAAKTDDFIRPIIIAAISTAMRKGDCCQLQWKDVNLETGFITVKTSKTRQTVSIPISELFYNELVSRKGNHKRYVFPEQALKYRSNPKYLTARLRKVLAIAGFRDEDKPPTSNLLTDYDPADLKCKAALHIATVPTESKRERMTALLSNYLAGDPLCKTAETNGIPKGTASGYLKEIEEATGIAFIRGQRSTAPLPTYAPKRGNIHEERASGLNRASVRDFHSFRTTWITIALCSGMPYELVTKVTGHTTARVVMDHYFHPQQDQLKEAFQKHMPNLLSAGSITPAERAAQIIRAMNNSNWKSKAKEALQVLVGDDK